MKNEIVQAGAILLVGRDSLTWSIAVCLLSAGHKVNLWASNEEEAEDAILSQWSAMNAETNGDVYQPHRLNISANLTDQINGQIAIMITAEDVVVKKDKIRQLENRFSGDMIIAVNSESIGLESLQLHSHKPERIIGLNWAEPAYTTRFLEVISNTEVKENITDQICDMARAGWKKDPYIVQNFGIRSRLISSMVREAFYLVENGYASVEDIDRACRNDAGYYLPFAGNCRYMDLMGTNGYGMVMKDLNPDLSKAQTAPDFFNDILKEGGLGMQNKKGLYRYTDAEARQWKNTIREFSYRIEKIIDKYPFQYKEKRKG